MSILVVEVASAPVLPPEGFLHYTGNATSQPKPEPPPPTPHLLPNLSTQLHPNPTLRQSRALLVLKGEWGMNAGSVRVR